MGRRPTTSVLEIMTAVRAHPEITNYRELANYLSTTRQTLHNHLGPRQGAEKQRIQTCFRMRRALSQELRRIARRDKSRRTEVQRRSYRKQFYMYTTCNLYKCLGRRPTKVELAQSGIYESTILQDLGWPSMNAFWIDVERALAR